MKKGLCKDFERPSGCEAVEHFAPLLFVKVERS